MSRALDAKRFPLDKLKADFARDGYLVLPQFYSEATLNRAYQESRELLQREQDIVVDDLHTGERSRLGWIGLERFDTGRYKASDLFLRSEIIRELAFGSGLDVLLQELMGQPPVLCNSLHFEKGSAQPLHIDALYMTPRTPTDLIAIWVAFEDARAEAGPLEYVPGSHLIPPYKFSTGNQHFVPAEMPAWHAYIETEIQKRGLKPITFLAGRGDVFVWHAQLVHGGGRVLDNAMSRRSSVFHYFSRRDCDALDLESLPIGKAFWMNRDMAPVPVPESKPLTESDFNEQSYLKRNPDVAAAVAAGQFRSGFHHYTAFGHREGREI